MTATTTKMTTKNESQPKRLSGSSTADTIATVISTLLMETAGVARLVGRQSKGVRVLIKDDSIQVNIRFIADFGKPIPEIARLIQNQAKDIVANEFKDYRLTSVNVWVEGIRFNQDSSLYRTAAVSSLSTSLAYHGGPDVKTT